LVFTAAVPLVVYTVVQWAGGCYMSNESDYAPSAHLLFSYIVMSPNYGRLTQYYTRVKCLAVHSLYFAT